MGEVGGGLDVEGEGGGLVEVDGMDVGGGAEKGNFRALCRSF